MDVSLCLQTLGVVALFKDEPCDAIRLVTFDESHNLLCIWRGWRINEACSVSILEDERAVLVPVADSHVGTTLGSGRADTQGKVATESRSDAVRRVLLP